MCVRRDTFHCFSGGFDDAVGWMLLVSVLRVCTLHWPVSVKADLFQISLPFSRSGKLSTCEAGGKWRRVRQRMATTKMKLHVGRRSMQGRSCGKSFFLDCLQVAWLKVVEKCSP